MQDAGCRMQDAGCRMQERFKKYPPLTTMRNYAFLFTIFVKIRDAHFDEGVSTNLYER
ncbi:hypothetical protein ATR01nite_19660 [Acetobacter tropicalis]|uniref:Uncharacterized protein n=1 Tax=Acetobacter tropicalis TaxID=104102 RepID=A0A511FPM2_9PROT|nr:hypothetical protein ATR01nite_19660 [Acetobacter tropicalis]